MPVVVPQLCKTHQVLLVKQCGYGPSDPWQALMIATQITLFQGVTADPRVYAQLNGNAENISTLGCLACRKPDLFGTLIDEVQKTPRLSHIGTIKRLGERLVQEAAAPTKPDPVSIPEDIWALWPDGYMCPIQELDSEVRNGRSDDVQRVRVLSYDETGCPGVWEVLKEKK